MDVHGFRMPGWEENMGKITKITQVTKNPYLNFFELDTVNKVGRESHYYVASRAKKIGRAHV